MYQVFVGSVEVRYKNFSDDGKSFYKGFEKTIYSYQSGAQYEADVEISGEKLGEMRLRAQYSGIGVKDFSPPKLLFGLSKDGKLRIFGHVTYEGVTLKMEGFLP